MTDDKEYKGLTKTMTEGFSSLVITTKEIIPQNDDNAKELMKSSLP